MAEKGGYKHFMLKEVFEQPRAIKDTMLGRIGQESGRVFLDEINISEEDFSQLSAGEDHRVRHQLARGSGGQVHHRASRPHTGRSRLRQRVSLPRSHHSTEHVDHRHFAIGRNGRYAGGAARGETERLRNAGHLQRRRLHDHPRSDRHTDHPRRARRSASPPPKRSRRSSPRSIILGMYLGQLRGTLSARSLAPTGAGDGPDSRQAGTRALRNVHLRQDRQVPLPRAPTSSISAAASTSRLRSKARSS